MGEIELRRSGTNDADELADILTRATQRKISYNDFSWGEKPYTTNEVINIIESGLTFLCYNKDELIGTVSIKWADNKSWPTTSKKVGYIHKLATKKEYAGYGVEILNQAEDILRKNDCHVARLDCEEQNESLRQYYELQGYRFIATSQASKSGYRAALYEKILVRS